MTILIERDVPIPSSKRGERRNRYPFADMNVGDSFAVDGGLAQSVKAAASNRTAKHGGKFVTRLDGNRIRCWRTA
jgi:hypothetical protein